MAKPTRMQLIDSLRSPLCPACARQKKVSHSFCGQCFRSLPRQIKFDLYLYIGCGYEEAFDAALAHLGVTVPVWPEPDEVEEVSS